MASKKNNQVKVLSFNKANAKLFAENIFSDKNGRVSFLKLCDGSLSNGKDGGRTLHCTLGEAYFTFVNPNVAKFVNSITKKFGDDITNEDNTFNPKYGNNDHTDHIPSLAVVDALVDAAQLRNKDVEVKKALAKALLETMVVNDDSYGDTCSTLVEDAMQRSKEVAEAWLDRVVPLLK